MKNITVIVLLIFSSYHVFSQSTTDSLKAVLESKITNKERVDTYNQLIPVNELDITESKIYFEKALKLSKENHYVKGEVNANYFWGIKLANTSNSEQSNFILNKALALAQLRSS